MLILTLSHIKGFILVLYLFAAILIVLLSWLYLTRTNRATKSIGLHAPEYIKILVQVSIANAIVTACLIIFFLIANIY